MKKCKREQHGLPHFVLMRRLLKTCLANHCQSGGRLHVNILAWGLEKRSSQGTQTAQHPAWRSHFRKVSLQASLGDKSSGGGGVLPLPRCSPLVGHCEVRYWTGWTISGLLQHKRSSPTLSFPLQYQRGQQARSPIQVSVLPWLLTWTLLGCVAGAEPSHSSAPPAS